MTSQDPAADTFLPLQTSHSDCRRSVQQVPVQVKQMRWSLMNETSSVGIKATNRGILLWSETSCKVHIISALYHLVWEFCVRVVEGQLCGLHTNRNGS